MLETITSVFTEVIKWLSTFVTSIFAETPATGMDLTALQPLLFIGVGISILMVSVKLVRKIMWGN